MKLKENFWMRKSFNRKYNKTGERNFLQLRFQKSLPSTLAEIMKFKSLYTNQEHYYSIGIDEESGDYVMEVVITHIACYSRFFRLTEDEIKRFKDQEDSLNGIAGSFASPAAIKVYAKRLIYSQKTEENKIKEEILSNRIPLQN